MDNQRPTSSEVGLFLLENLMKFELPKQFTEYADQLAAVADPLLIERMKSAGLNRSFRRRLQSMSRKGTLKGSHFPVWLIARFISTGDGAFA